MTETAIPEGLKLALEHLTAVRELDRYLRKKGVEKDIGRYIKETVCPALQERLPAIRSWTCEVDEESVEWQRSLLRSPYAQTTSSKKTLAPLQFRTPV